MAMHHKSERPTSNLDYYWGMTHYSTSQVMTSTIPTNMFTKNTNVLKCCNFCSYLKKVLRFENVILPEGWYGISPTVVQLKYHTLYNIEVCYLKWM